MGIEELAYSVCNDNRAWSRSLRNLKNLECRKMKPPRDSEEKPKMRVSKKSRKGFKKEAQLLTKTAEIPN